LNQIQSSEINKKVKGVGGLSGQVIESFDIPKPFQYFRYFSHTTVILGTLIWGFGDFTLQKFLENL